MMKWRVKVDGGVIMIHFNFYKAKGSFVWVTLGELSFIRIMLHTTSMLLMGVFFSFLFGG